MWKDTFIHVHIIFLWITYFSSCRNCPLHIFAASERLHMRKASVRYRLLKKSENIVVFVVIWPDWPWDKLVLVQQHLLRKSKLDHILYNWWKLKSQTHSCLIGVSKLCVSTWIYNQKTSQWLLLCPCQAKRLLLSWWLSVLIVVPGVCLEHYWLKFKGTIDAA